MTSVLVIAGAEPARRSDVEWGHMDEAYALLMDHSEKGNRGSRGARIAYPYHGGI